MSGWAQWRAVCDGAQTEDPVFLAVRDATQRFAIPLSLLDELVAGVTMDLDRGDGGAPDTYATFADLYRYCYLVASVVGLVCIRIFGYKDARAEKFAEETGIAFQLTNILRDVAEDAGRNRVYLPLEDLAAHGVSLDSLLHRAAGAPPTANERALLEAIAERAEYYYRSAEALLPFIDRESRPALQVLVAVYHALLKRIERADYDVFSQRASVPLRQKLAILAVGLTRMTWARLVGLRRRREGLNGSSQSSQKTVTVVGGGVAGMSAACALAEAGLRVQLGGAARVPGRAGEFVSASGRE